MIKKQTLMLIYVVYSSRYNKRERGIEPINFFYLLERTVLINVVNLFAHIVFIIDLYINLIKLNDNEIRG